VCRTSPYRAHGSQLPQLSPSRVPQFVLDKLEQLLKDVKPLGHPRANQEDVVGALINAATPDKTAKALQAYNPKLGTALVESCRRRAPQSARGDPGRAGAPA
jgi:hypothetical protein